jgi:hypothetical protein
MDRLTLDEARATGAQTLEVVYGLVQHRRVVMGGKNAIARLSHLRCSRFIPLDLDDMASADSIRKVLGLFDC